MHWGRIWLPFAILVSFTTITWLMCKESGRVHDKLSVFEARARKSSDYNELVGINRELITYAKARCIRGQADRAYAINQFIIGKLAGLKAAQEITKN